MTAEKQIIRRLTCGLYDHSKHSQRPPTCQISMQSHGPSSARGANKLSLIIHVHAKTIYFTNVPPRTKQIGRHTINLRNAADLACDDDQNEKDPGAISRRRVKLTHCVADT